MKKVFISYKQTWISESELEKNLWFLRKKIEKLNSNFLSLRLKGKMSERQKGILNYKTLIYYFDDNSDLSAEVLDKKFLENIKIADIFISFLNYKEKSEGQLMELGMAYALWKRIILLVNNKVKDNYYLAYWTTKEIYYFDSLQDLDFTKILN